jgi:hypothetical protein
MSRASKNTSYAVELSVQFEIVAPLGVRVEVEEPIVLAQASSHEDIEGVMHIIRRQTKVCDRAGDVAVAVGSALFVTDQLVEPLVTPTIHQIVRSGVAGQWLVRHCIGDDGEHRPHAGRRRPKPVADREMRALQQSRASGPEHFLWIVFVPCVEVGHLLSLDAGDPHNVVLFHKKRLAAQAWNNQLAHHLTRTFVCREAHVIGLPRLVDARIVVTSNRRHMLPHMYWRTHANRLRKLEQIPLGLNRRDSQALVNERVCPP